RLRANPMHGVGAVLLALIVVAAGGIGFLLLSPPARATQDGSGFPSITFESYTIGGQTTQLGCGGSDCPTIPTGATVDIRVWVDLYMCDPVTIYYGAQGAGSTTTNFNGAFSEDFQHTYSYPGTYPVEAVASDCNGGYYSDAVPLAVANSTGNGFGLGGGLPGLNGPLVVPALLAMLLGLIALIAALTVGLVGPGSGAALGAARVTKVGPGGLPVVAPGGAPKPFDPPHLTGIPYSTSLHVASLMDIPVGAERIDPGRIPFRPGTPTDIWQAPSCPVAGCGDLVYTSAGWFSPSPTCPLRTPGGALTAFPTVGQHYVGG
ncbi:MAG: hypothetical protein L3J91_01595, partial [Thermoplasmata archaeon]|nr:hypothetical protein [Thermoplasmata archaeon]